MTVNSTKITSGPYVGNDIADTFSYTFKVEDKNQLSVYETTDTGVETLLVVDTDYTVNNIGVDGGGTITRLAGALPTDYQWYIRSNYEETQLTAFSSQGPFFPDLHENAMDKLTFLIQQLLDEKSRSPSVSKSYSGELPLTLDDPIAGYAVRWNGGETGLENYDPSTLSNEEIANDKVVINYQSLLAAKADTSIKLNQACKVKDRNSSMWDVVPSGTFPVSSYVVNHDTLPLQLALRLDSLITPATLGFNADATDVSTGTDDSGVLSEAFDLILQGVDFDFGQSKIRITSSVIKTLTANQELRLRGTSATIYADLPTPGAHEGAVDITGDGTNVFIVKGIDLIQDITIASLRDGWYIKDMLEFYMEDCVTEGAGQWGVNPVDCANAVQNRTYENLCGAGGTAFQGCDRVRKFGGGASNNGFTVNSTGYGVTCATGSTGGQNNIDIVVSGGTYKDNIRKSIDVHNGTNVVVTDNIVSGFGSGGIYAVNEGGAKVVKDVIIKGNVIDNLTPMAGNILGIQAIQVGSFGAGASNAGSFIVSDNLINKPHGSSTATSSIAISVKDDSDAVDNVHVMNNIVLDACPSGGAGIQIAPDGVIDEIKVHGNTVVCENGALNGISVRSGLITSVIGNTFRAKSGTVINGIVQTTEAVADPKSIAIGNHVVHDVNISNITFPINLFDENSLNNVQGVARRGVITLTTGSASLVVSNVNVYSESVISIVPVTAAAAQTMSNQGVYVTAQVYKTGFTITTGDGLAPAANSVFRYFID